MDIDVTEEQLTRLREGEDIDVVMPTITYEERDFLLTGATPEEVDSQYDDRPSKRGAPYTGHKGWDYDDDEF